MFVSQKFVEKEKENCLLLSLFKVFCPIFSLVFFQLGVLAQFVVNNMTSP